MKNIILTTAFALLFSCSNASPLNPTYTNKEISANDINFIFYEKQNEETVNTPNTASTQTINDTSEEINTLFYNPQPEDDEESFYIPEDDETDTPKVNFARMVNHINDGISANDTDTDTRPDENTNEEINTRDINSIFYNPLNDNMLTQKNLNSVKKTMYSKHHLLVHSLKLSSKVEIIHDNSLNLNGFLISEINVYGDGNCGYTALGVLRSDVFNRLCDFLTPHSENYNAEVKDYITSEIAMQCAYWSIMKPDPKEELQLLAWFYETPFSDLKNSEDVNFQLSKLIAQNLEDIQKRLEREDETYDFFYQKLSQIEDPEVYEAVVLPFLKYTVLNKTFDGSNRDTPPFWLQIGSYDQKSLADVIAKYILKKKIVLISIQNDSGSVFKILGGEIDQNDPPESIGWIINKNNIHYTRGILIFQNTED